MQALFDFGGALAQVRDMAVALLDPFRAPVDDVVHHRGQTLRIEEAVFQVIDHGGVQ
ncbi:hypothetical protein [Caulobacter zeae]|uniref:hypothetical protein n=1 Tax=Caulobacter zeae TaxID=2055137 RepID=UPI001F0BFE52|nr:hypothetical protein [Caulobacter zeae]